MEGAASTQKGLAQCRNATLRINRKLRYLPSTSAIFFAAILLENNCQLEDVSQWENRITSLYS
jgi:hypothetical protein